MYIVKIERVDEKTVKCYISNEELEEYDITYKDFLSRSEKAKEIVEDIIEQAEELGFQPPKFAFDLQIMMLPDKGMVLTFSEKEVDKAVIEGHILDYIKELGNLKKGGKTDAMFQVENSDMETKKEIAKNSKAKKPVMEKNASNYALFVFESLQILLQFVNIIPKNLRIHSVLYVMQGKYYLNIEKGTAAYEKYSRVCIRALEYGTLYAASEDKITYVKEHGECLIEEKAIAKLRYICA